YTIDDYIRLGERMLARHYDKYTPFDQGTLLGTEVWTTFDLPGTLFKFRGKIDKLWKREDGVVEICDYKTGVKLPNPHDPEFRTQMGIYQMGVENLYPYYDNIEVVQFSLRHDEMIRYRIHPDEMEQLAEDIRLAVVTILEAERSDNFPPKETNLCDYCDYIDLCPAKRHRRILHKAESEETDSSLNSAEKIKAIADNYLAKHKEHKAISDELNALKKKVKEIAREHDLTTLSGDTGDVNVKLENTEKFITKSSDSRKFADLTNLARKLKLDDYFTLDAENLMKEIVIKRRLPDEQLEQFRQFIVEGEASRVSVKLRKNVDDDE
ncbi:MAG: PD-(D/E)XK nuclease family protein, partial [candidate division Zixibacteria bacterium]|nr:PD-(D/E)XK nuclease family protein [candidate division Zixibacteria bacterium]